MLPRRWVLGTWGVSHVHVCVWRGLAPLSEVLYQWRLCTYMDGEVIHTCECPLCLSGRPRPSAWVVNLLPGHRAPVFAS